jgi:hypothetical protein
MPPMALKEVENRNREAAGRVAEKVAEKAEEKAEENQVVVRVEGNEKEHSVRIALTDIMDRRVLTMIPPRKDRKVIIIRLPRKGPRHRFLQSTSMMTMIILMAVKKNILRLFHLIPV